MDKKLLTYLHSLETDKKLTLSLILVFLILITFIYIYSKNNSEETEKKDPIFEKVIQRNLNTIIYSQHVETETLESDIKMQIIGDYDLDFKNNSFRSVATTSLLFLDSKNKEEHLFNITNISIKDQIYTIVRTDSDFIKSRMPDSNKWLNFNANNIPEKYADIMIPGPVINNLRIFSANGSYLKMLGKNDTEDEIHYTLKLSDNAFTQKGLEDMGVIPKRVDKNGTIDIWIDPKNFLIKKLVMKNYPYVSTTTIYNTEKINIEAPVL